jgi:hypothetical protein
MPLEGRIKRWLITRIRAAAEQDNLTDKRIKMIANRIISTLRCDEERAKARAAAKGGPPPPPPVYKRPDDIDALLGAKVLRKIPKLEEGTKAAIWALFQNVILVKLDGALPLCPSNYGRGETGSDK